MLSKSKFLKTTVLAALIGLAGAAAISPASAHEYDRGRGGYSHSGYDRGGERDSGRGSNRDDRGDRGDRNGGYHHERDNQGSGRHHNHRNW